MVIRSVTSISRILVLVLLIASRFAASSLAFCQDPAAQPPAAQDPQLHAASLELFEKQIRPALETHCLECHAANTEASGGLLLDSARGWQLGGDSGAAIIPGEPDQSLLLQAISYSDPNLQMPSDGKLDPDVIEAFRRWIELGAADPRETDPASAPHTPQIGLPVERAAEHWAYRPITQHPVPFRSNASSPIDSWIELQLEQQLLVPNTSVSAAPLLRRLTFDLHGLPPTREALAEFTADQRPDALNRQVDRLLASPHFSERFARHWMDVSRFGESLTLRGFVLPEAWRYKEFLIEAFDRDLDYDRFVRLQIAGDLAAESYDEPDLLALVDSLADSSTAQASLAQAPGFVRAQQFALAATGYLVLGNTNLEEQDKRQLEMDIIDEQLDVIGKGLLGQTISCARCHDHKFDPIPARDYYALAGILKGVQVVKHANVSEWIDRPLPLTPDELARFEQLAATRQELQHQHSMLEASIKTLEGSGAPVAGPLDPTLLPGIIVDDEQAVAIGDWTHSVYSSNYVGSGYRHDGAVDQGTKTLTFQPSTLAAGEYELRAAYNHGSSRASNALFTVFSAEGEHEIRVDQRQAGAIEGRWVSLGRFRFETGGQSHVILSNTDADGHVIADAIQYLPLDSPVTATTDTAAAPTEISELKSKLAALSNQLKQLDQQLAARPKTHGVLETGTAVDLPIHVRGSVHNLGEPTARGYLQAVSVSLAPPTAVDQSGRRELAAWLTHPEQPLTHRVWVNRVWGWLMGSGLVSTVDNFGTTGEAPSHPELLDYLVEQLRHDQGSTKALVRRVVTSDAYARGWSVASADAAEIDPNSRLFWRGSRRRVDAESLRDAMLAVSGELSSRHQPVRLPADRKEDYGYVSHETTRTMLLPVLRNSIPDLLKAFDAADTSVVIGERNRSTVAPQALALMHDPWVRARAAAAAKRWLNEVDFAEAGEPVMSENEVRELMERISWDSFGRAPTSAEQALGARFLSRPDHRDSVALHSKLTDLVQAWWASIDFRYLE